ncbi:TIGR02569 family protein [Haloechinothrix salitolerans]|uniref:TIGR02569 family protein n=1 Tax=Haloechinothrix salitolerans TaxID=926830 RepID=A0ABW2C7P9_9PSEU
MSTIVECPPGRVCAAFGVDEGELEPFGELGWRTGRLTLLPVADSEQALWLARSLNDVHLPDLRIARPARATDGRQVVGGWMALRAIDGEPADPEKSTVDDLVLVSVKLHQALAHMSRPDFIDKRDDALARADRMAWGEDEADLDDSSCARWFDLLLGATKPVPLKDQVVHANLYRGVLFFTDAAPAIVDFRPFFRPPEWSAALVVVDAIADGKADVDVMARWEHIPAWRQMLLRAVLFRLAAGVLDSDTGEDARERLRHAASTVSRYV